VYHSNLVYIYTLAMPSSIAYNVNEKSTVANTVANPSMGDVNPSTWKRAAFAARFPHAIHPIYLRALNEELKLGLVGSIGEVGSCN